MTRVLVVARWYPSHDVPHRGAFVADLVEALTRVGVDQVVASYEHALVGGPPEQRPAVTARAEATWSDAVRDPAVLNVPGGWGAPGVPVARLPVLDDPLTRSSASSVQRHAALLVPFAEALSDRWPIDIVHAHTGVPDGLAAALLANRLGVPFVVTEHGSNAAARLAQEPDTAASYRALAQAETGRLIAVSPSLAGQLAEAGGIDPRRIAVIPNAVPIDRFALGGSAERRPGELLYVGTRSDDKGTGVLLRAFARLYARDPSLRLRLVGPSAGGDDRWMTLAAQLAILDAVKFEPATDRAGVAEAMRRAAVFVHPSRSETFGMVAAEALATGLPVVASPSGGVDAIVARDGRCGEIADGPDDAALAAAIERLLARRHGLDAAEIRQSVASRFGAPVVAGRIREIYEELAPTARPGSPTARGSAVEVGAPVVGPPDVRHVFVVGAHRARLGRRLASMDPEAPGDLDIVTAARPPSQPAARLSAEFRIVEIDDEGEYRAALAAAAGPRLPPIVPPRLRRILRAALGPRALLRRRRLRTQREAMRQVAFARGVAAAWVAHRRDLDPAAASWLVACDADDVDLLRPLLGQAARIAPGSLRWLEDARSAARHG